MLSRLFCGAFLTGVVASTAIAETTSQDIESHDKAMEHIEVIGYSPQLEIDHAIAQGSAVTTQTKQAQRRELLRTALEHQLEQMEAFRAAREDRDEETLAQEAPVTAPETERSPAAEDGFELIPVGEVEGEEDLEQEAVETEPS